jgi:hypothetical protein
MAFAEALAERIRQGSARPQGSEEKKLFGGIGYPESTPGRPIPGLPTLPQWCLPVPGGAPSPPAKHVTAWSSRGPATLARFPFRFISASPLAKRIFGA